MIFESPDGGKTVYARNFGEHRKYQWEKTIQEQALISDIVEDILWREIRMSAKEDAELQKALDRVKVLYYLKKKDGSR